MIRPGAGVVGWSSYLRELSEIWSPPGAGPRGGRRVELAPTRRDVMARDGTARLYRFVGGHPPAGRRPLLLVPSLINRWYVLDLRPGASLVAALVAAGHDLWCLDWGIPEDEDRYLSWDDVVARLARMARRTLRITGADRLGLLGYCMGGTLAAIHAALHPGQVAALIDLAGPIDFAAGGVLRRLVDRRWFDADAIADAGNVAPAQMQAGFVALRPTLELSKWVAAVDRAVLDAATADRAAADEVRAGVEALDTWAADNIAFPAEAYRTYIRDLYQDNQLVAGGHRVGGRAVELGAIDCPTLVVVAERDTICPPPAATALLDHVATTDTTTIEVPGGHVGAVVGRRASRELYPALAGWLGPRLDRRHRSDRTTAGAHR